MEYLFAPERYESDGFLIRSFLPGDGSRLHEAVNASVDHLSPWMPWVRAHQSMEESERCAREFRGRYLLVSDFALAVLTPDEATLLGGTGFHLREGPLRTLSAEVGMWIRESHAGEGLGTRVLKAVVDWGFSEWPWERLAWHCDAQNGPSARVAEKAGMRLEGTHRNQYDGHLTDRRDTLIFGLTRGERRGSRSVTP